ncbi:ribosomal protection-like ABC-F family protein [Bacteroidota bacterium]
MLSISNLTYYIAGRPLYKNASIHVNRKDKIGLVGLNGSGKSTLLRIIYGEITPDNGTISKEGGCTIGFLNQDLLSFETDESILTVAMQAFNKTLEIQRKIDKLLTEIKSDHDEKLINKLSELQEKLESLDGYTIQAQAEEMLEGMGFTTADLSRSLIEFSGGWRMRVILAKLLLERPSLLMLDEPTNHLDLPSIQWVENYLATYEGAVIIVSHDQKFLDRIAQQIVEVSHLKLNTYKGNYSTFLKEKALRLEIQKNAFINQQQEIKQTERFIERFRAKNTKARQVQSKIKSLEKLDKVEEIQEGNKSISIRFAFSRPSGRHVIRLENLSKSYGDLSIMKNTNASIERGDKISLIGANGKGKSTLLRIIADKEPFQGKRTPGHNVFTSFYAQHQLEALDISHEILDEMKYASSQFTEQELRSLLGSFLFSGEDVYKKIRVLSGGEKSRVALAKTLVSDANFLILDEPTNHLDMLSVNVLTQALQKYEGTIIMVSHDRQFISDIANKIWYIENFEIKEYPGIYDEFHIWFEAKKPQKSKSPKSSVPKSKTTNKIHYDETRATSREIRSMESKIAKKEIEIEELEIIKKTIEKDMGMVEIYSSYDLLSEKNNELQSVNVKLSEAHKEWEYLYIELETLQSRNA